MRAWTRRISLSFISMLLVLPLPADAQSADELAKQTQNPVASLIESVPLQGNWTLGLGDRGRRLAAQHSTGHAVRDQQEYERHPARHRAAHVSTRID